VRGGRSARSYRVAMTALILTLLVAIPALVVCVRRVPLATLLCIGLVGLAEHAGVVSLPAAVSAPLASVRTDVRTWQTRQVSALTCQVAQTRALSGDSQQELDRAAQLCTTTER
jgi:hypothetical protein